MPDLYFWRGGTKSGIVCRLALNKACCAVDRGWGGEVAENKGVQYRGAVVCLVLPK